MQDLEISLRDNLDNSFREAKAKVNSGNLESGVELAEQTWNRLPEPKFGWDVSKSYTHALAAIYRDTKQFSKAVALMNDLFASGTVKPYQDQPYFVLGTIYFEMGDMENARKWFKDANQISKGRCFQGEPSKYKETVRSSV